MFHQVKSTKMAILMRLIQWQPCVFTCQAEKSSRPRAEEFFSEKRNASYAKKDVFIW